MSVGVWPIFFTNARLRTESTGYMELALKLCGKPSVCPTSCAVTYSTSRPMSV